MTNPYSSLKWGNAEHTVIVAYRHNGTGALIEEPGNSDLWSMLTSGSLGEIAEFEGPRIEELRDAAITKVNRAAGAKRQTFITTIPGQEMLYLAKEQTARAWLADLLPTKSLSSYPLLEAEVGITADTADDLAAIWVAMADQWRGAASQIEQARLGSIKQIETAADKAAIDQIVASCMALLA